MNRGWPRRPSREWEELGKHRSAVACGLTTSRPGSSCSRCLAWAPGLGLDLGCVSPGSGSPRLGQVSPDPDQAGPFPALTLGGHEAQGALGVLVGSQLPCLLNLESASPVLEAPVTRFQSPASAVIRAQTPMSWGGGSVRLGDSSRSSGCLGLFSTSEHSDKERSRPESAGEMPLWWGQLAAPKEAVRTALLVPRKAGRRDIRDSAGQTLASERKLRGGSLWLEAGKCFPTIV